MWAVFWTTACLQNWNRFFIFRQTYRCVHHHTKKSNFFYLISIQMFHLKVKQVKRHYSSFSGSENEGQRVQVRKYKQNSRHRHKGTVSSNNLTEKS
jgi:hypothetical protein